MRRTGRELTLFSIYGSPDAPPPRDAAKKPKRRPVRVRPAINTVAVVGFKPTRPPARSDRSAAIGADTAVARDSVEGLMLDPHDISDGDTTRENDGNQSNEDKVVTAPVMASSHSSHRRGQNAEQAILKVQSPEAPAPRKVAAPKSPTARADGELRGVGQELPKVVMACYGDGFLELTPNKNAGVACLGVPFNLRIRIFKAADELKEQDKGESDASRHLYPELNDDGEFVRWSCCGGTDKSVYGCPVASHEQTHDLGVDELLKLRPPKLLACKIADAVTTNDVQFVIFDRGFPGGNRPSETGALNAGCRVWWRGFECWATQYDIPHSRWLDFAVSFDGYYLRVFVDGDVVDTAVVQHQSRVSPPLCRSSCALAGRYPGSQWSSSASLTKSSIFVGGYSKYSTCVNDWRLRAGFVGLIADILISSRSQHDRTSHADSTSTYIVSLDVGQVEDVALPRKYDVVVHRNLFWRKVFPPLFQASGGHNGVVRLRGNFYHGAHHDLSSRNSNSFENVLLSVVQIGDVRVQIELARSFASNFGADHGCRTQAEYDIKCNEFIRYVSQLSPLLVVEVNARDDDPPTGSLEVSLELSRSPGSQPVSILLHSMLATSCFPSQKDIKAKIVDIIAHEARRSPGEEVFQQAVRYFLSLASQARDCRERAFLESVINRKAVITEKRISAVFQRLGFHFSLEELQELIRVFKAMQDDYLRHQHRMDDIPTMSMLSPTSTGMYRLPLIHQATVSSITPSERTATRSPWSFVTIMLNYDLQLLDFIHEGCPESSFGNAEYTQSRYLHGGFVDRLSLQISELPSHVYCVVFSLRRRHCDHDHERSGDLKTTRNGILVQLENGETLHQLAQFETQPSSDCKWFSLAALYRSRKSKLWRFQALGGSTHAASIHTSLEEMNAILVERHIVQVYEVRISYEEDGDPLFAEFAGRFSKNIRFGRNGKIVMLARTKSTSDSIKRPAPGDRDPMGCRSAKFEVALRIQGMETDVPVYRHDESTSSLPTVQSICRSILRTLADHGIKESLQQNPFVAGAKKLKRLVTIRATSEETNTPVANAYIFIEHGVDNQKAVASLASKIVPTLTMGSRLVSIRKRLQQRKYADEVKFVAREFVSEVVDLGTRYAVISLRDAKLVPIVNSRALLRRAMRRRREHITQRILDAMSESERSRIYSRNGPIRLQQLLRPTLSLSSSEKELVNEIVEMKIDAFRQQLGLVESEQIDASQHDHVDEIWQTRVRDERSPSVSSSTQQQDGDAQAIQLLNKLTGHAQSSETQEQKKRSFVTNAKGVVTCHLAPGSYSLYVFHTDYFEWTSLAVVFPTVSASGLHGGSLSTSAPQEIVVPLEAFKWSYGIQLVDFYQQQNPKQVEGVPIVITDKCTTEQTIVKTLADGSVTWDVRKGIYSIRALTENTSIVYSGSKNVVVDGGRYHPPRTIFIPVLLGKIAIQLVVCSAIVPKSAVSDSSCQAQSAVVQFLSEGELQGDNSSVQGTHAQQPSDHHHPDEDSRALAVHTVTLHSSSQFQLRPGTYKLNVTVDGCFPYYSLLDAPWNASASVSCRNVIVMCPIVTTLLEFRVIFSYVNAIGVMDAMIDVKDDQSDVKTFWAHGTDPSDDDVQVHGTVTMDMCEYQTFTLRCQPGRTYDLRVGATRLYHLASLRPRVQVYATTGLVLDVTLQEDFDWNKDFYWRPCAWTDAGEITPTRVESM